MPYTHTLTYERAPAEILIIIACQVRDHHGLLAQELCQAVPIAHRWEHVAIVAFAWLLARPHPRASFAADARRESRALRAWHKGSEGMHGIRREAHGGRARRLLSRV
jgi:hypothetical protein